MRDSNRSDLPGCVDTALESLDPDRPDRVHALYCNWVHKFLGLSTGKRDMAPDWVDPLAGFKAFYRDLSPTWFPGAQLARRRRDSSGEVVEVDGLLPYGPGTCEWVTPEENQADLRRASSSSRLRTWCVEGDIVTTADVAETCGISMSLAYARLLNGWDTWDALAKPKGARKPRSVAVRKYRIAGLEGVWTAGDLYRLAASYGLGYKTISARLERGVRDAAPLFAPQQNVGNRLGTGRQYLVDGRLYTTAELREILPPEVHHLLYSRLHLGWDTLEDLARDPHARRRH